MPPRKEFVLTDEQRQLAEDNIRLAYWYAGKICNREPTRLMGMTYDDCVSLAMEALCRAAHWYRADGGSSFAAAYELCARSMYGHLVKLSSSGKRRDAVAMLSLDTLKREPRGDGRTFQEITLKDAIASDEPDMLDRIIRKDAAARAIELANELPLYERRVFVARAVECKTPREVAEARGLQVRSVNNMYSAAKRHLRRRMEKEGSL